MSAYPGHGQYNTEYSGPISSSNNVGSNPSGNGNNATMRGPIPSIGNPLVPSTQQQATQPAPTAQPQPQASNALLYDMSSFDPLQAQALQLSASAGLTTADILAAAAPSLASAPASTHDGGNNSGSSAQPGIVAGIAQPLSSYTQPLSQPPSTSIPTVPGQGQLRPIQPSKAAPSTTTTQTHTHAQTVTAIQNPYIFIQPQQLQANSISSSGSAAAPFAATAAQNALLMPAGAPGAPASLASTQAQVAAVAAATAAGFGAHPQLLFNQALLTAAAAQGVPGIGTAAARHVIQPQTSQVSTATAGTNPLGVPLILPASAINVHPINAKKRSLNNGVVMNEIAPSVVSSTTVPAKEGNKRQRQSKKVNNAEEASKAEDPAEKRRYERNLREQQRSSKISSQIKELREVLADCNVPFKPNKYSILLKVVEYIKQLQSRAIMLDAEHQKLIATVRQTNEMIANNGISSGGVTDNDSSDLSEAWRSRRESGARGTNSGESNMCFVKGIDYRSVFEQCPTAFGIAALDGRILDCNVEFQGLLGYSTREDLLKQSLFNLVHNHQDIFRAMAKMLKTAEEPPTTATATTNVANESGSGVADTTATIEKKSTEQYWTGPVISKQNVRLLMNITLTLGGNGTPKFFSCALTTSTI